ncbi:MAG: tRNA (adenosine(37)-N6)-threonylcarbamoyltransferase complex dimerization subunit type 1 TsaB [Pseudohongiellaceae bacterium]
MLTLLNIDTASAITAVSLELKGALLTKEAAEGRYAAQQILPLINEVLAESATSLATLDGIGIATGPGSFTGIRIGLGIAQGLAYPHNLPLIPVSSLAVQAACACTQTNSARRVLVCQAAREREMYAAVYNRDEQSATAFAAVTLAGREQVCEPADFESEALKELPQDALAVCSDCPELATEICTRFGLQVPTLLPLSPRPIKHLAALARLGLEQGRVCQADELRPNYVREYMDYAV